MMLSQVVKNKFLKRQSHTTLHIIYILSNCVVKTQLSDFTLEVAHAHWLPGSVATPRDNSRNLNLHQSDGG